MADAVLVPYLELKIGKEKIRAVSHDLLEIVVQEQLGMSSEFTLKLNTWNPYKLAHAWVDDPRLAIGTEVTIKLGYLESLQTLIIGQILSLDFQLQNDTPATLTVKGQDYRHKLGRAQQTRVRRNVSDADLAQEIASAHKLAIQIDPALNGAKDPYVAQINMSDLAFLNKRASEAGADLLMSGKTLVLKRLKLSGTPDLTLTPGTGLLSFSASVTSTGRVGKVVVQTSAEGDEGVLTGEADVPNTLEGLLSADETFDDVVHTVIDSTLDTQAEVDERAQVEAASLASSYLTASATSFGNTKIRAGAVVKINGVGKRFSQKYLVTSATHSFSVSSGYQTSFELRGNVCQVK